VGVWNIAFFNSRRFEPDGTKSPQWNAGAYLANALGHCGECHTPRNFAFALKTDEVLAGQDLQGWCAYNITSDQRYGIGKWTDEELTEYLHTGHAKGRGAASGPMSEVVTYSLQYWDRQDISALIAYLRSVPARKGRRADRDLPAGAPAARSPGQRWRRKRRLPRLTAVRRSMRKLPRLGWQWPPNRRSRPPWRKGYQ